ncbi:MAG: M23 family metallopeptidase [Actinomycetota bacterium]|nr:M23 family metallopeptidase [Actinomycetota bacterium]
MARQAPPRAAHRARRQQERAVRRARLVPVVLVFAAVTAVTLLLTAFGSSTATTVPTAPAPAKRLLPTGPPLPEVVAVHGSLRIHLPVAQGRITAIGYHGAGNGALPLDPVGRRGNQGFLARLADRLVGRAREGLTYYQLPGSGSPTGALDVGAPAGTAVYAPVDGTVVGISPYVIDGRAYGSRLEIEPSSAPSLVVSMTHLRVSRGLSVGSPVVASRTKIGSVVDLSRVEYQALARYTQDAGNNVSLEVHPAATLVVP